MTPAQLSAELNRQAESVCKFLLPNGKKSGHHWEAGDVSGCPGQSLKVVLSGDKIGVWSDFHTGEVGGDLLDLWRVVMGISLFEAMQQSADHLGIKRVDGYENRPQRTYKRPERPKNARKLNSEGKVYAYLKSRGLSDTTLEDFQVGEQNDQTILFPYKLGNDLINTKYLDLERVNGKKKCWQESGSEPILFGWQALNKRYPHTRIVCLTEGECDCMTYHQFGIAALSIPNGAGKGEHKQDWIESEYERMNRFDTIFISMDQDEAGQEAEKEIVRRLGAERCRLVKLPYKDANECLMKGVTHFNKLLVESKSLDPIELKPADYFVEDVVECFFPKPGTYQGMKTPWNSVNEAIRFNRAELVVWSGYSGSGKSQILGQVSIQGITQGERFVICSLEMPAKQTLARMARQIIGSGHPTEAQVRAAILWLRDKCWIVNIVGKMKTERILEVFRYAAKRYDIHNFILDSLTKCNIREDDYDAQKVFVDELCDFNHAHESTTHLVVHQRKPSGNSDRPDKFGARGAAAITDEASSVICVWRPSNDDEDDQNDSRFNTKKKSTKKDHNGVKVDCVLSIDKNRERGIEGRFNLFFDPQSLQFHETPQAVPIDYITSHFTRNGEDDGTF